MSDDVPPMTPASSEASRMQSSPAAMPAVFPPPATVSATGAAPPTARLVTVNAINWGNILEFTHLFRGFRLAINPAKLMLALFAIMMIYAAGRAFDFAWGPQADRNAIRQFAAQGSSMPGTLTWAAQRERNIDELLSDDHDLTLQQREQLKADPRAAHQVLRKFYREQFDQMTGAAPARLLLDRMRRLDDAVGYGVFDTFLQYETSQFDGLVENTLTFVRLTPVRAADAGSPGYGPGAETQAVSGGLLSRDPDRMWRSDTVVGCIANMAITAPRWLFTGTGPMQWRPDDADTWRGWIHMIAYRAMYLLTLSLLAGFAMVMLAFAGAAIARLSALELAGIERAPLKDVILFSVRRLWVFIKAPISPFLILLAVGLVLAVGGMIGAIPYAGPILLGAMFFLFLGVSFVLMLLVLGILGGFNLLYPTIAVEGADAFDAMSRSFAYAYSRPWQLAFYSITSLVYGVFTFLFVSFAVYLILLLTHTFAGWGMNLFGTHVGAFSGLPALETIWPSPRFLQLVQPINWYAMSWPEFLGAILLHFWVFLLITGIGAYVISYYFSTHTIIYLLLRRSVDGQNLREVYLENPPK